MFKAMDTPGVQDDDAIDRLIPRFMRMATKNHVVFFAADERLRNLRHRTVIARHLEAIEFQYAKFPPELPADLPEILFDPEQIAIVIAIDPDDLGPFERADGGASAIVAKMDNGGCAVLLKDLLGLFDIIDVLMRVRNDTKLHRVIVEND